MGHLSGQHSQWVIQMPPQHIIFIPAVLLMGFILGFSVRAEGGAKRDASEPKPSGSRRPFALALLAAIVVFVSTHLMPSFGGVHAVERAAHGLAVLDRAPAFRPDEVMQRLDSFGPAGRAAYKRMTYTSDVIFPVSILAFFLLLARYLRALRPSKIGQILVIFPIAWFLADMTENALIYSVLNVFPAVGRGTSVLGAVTVAKFALLLASTVMPILYLFLLRRRAAQAQEAARI